MAEHLKGIAASIAQLDDVLHAAKVIVDDGEPIVDLECLYCAMTWPAGHHDQRVHEADCIWLRLKIAIEAVSFGG